MTTSTTTDSTTDTPSANLHDHEFEETLAAIRDSAHELGGVSLAFTTDADDLWPAFLDALPQEIRQHHTCNACRRFVERFGSLVVVGDDGRTRPLLWSRAGVGVYGPAIDAMRRKVASARINGVLGTRERTWGQPVTGPWHHLAIEAFGLCPKLIIEDRPTATASQIAASIRHERGLLCAAIAEYPAELVTRAAAMLETGKLYRSEACIGVARWLVKIHEARAQLHGSARDHIMWRFAASAPKGWCHVKSGMIGTLLDDLAAGLPFETVARKFREKMDPMAYMRPTAAPSAGNVAQAEKIVEALGLAPALERRFAKLEDIAVKLWTPPGPKPGDGGRGGVFGEDGEPARGIQGGRGGRGVFDRLLKPKAEETTDVGTPPVTMTWSKFAATVLPTAERVELFAPHHGNYVAMVTAVHPDAPPILQWDRIEQRNPVSWYLENKGSFATRWNLRAGWVAVTAFCMSPPHWYGQALEKHAPRVFALLAGARDTLHEIGGGFFPQSLRSELHGVRSTLEAHAKQSPIAGRDEATACGYDLGSGSVWEGTFRVTCRGLRTTYRIDRWD